jgi:hypothetical protein
MVLVLLLVSLYLFWVRLIPEYDPRAIAQGSGFKIQLFLGGGQFFF